MWQPRETPARFLALGCGIALCALLASRHAWADGREWNALAAESNRQFEQGNHAAAERSARAALAHAERQFDASDRRLVISLKNLAILYRYMPRFAEAEQLIARAREAGERAHWSAADLADLEREATNIYLAQFKYEEAAQTAEREVQLLEKHLEKWAPKPRGGKGLMGTARQAAQRFVDRVLGLSAIYLMSGNYALAEASALRGRRTCEEYLRDDAQLAAPWVSLADVYGATGRYRQEDAFLRAALSHLESKAPNHPGIGSVLVRVAGIAMHHGRLADAEAMLERALKIKGRAKAGDLFVELNSIALLRERQGRHAEAEATLLRIIADMERTEGATNPDLAVPLNNLARHYRTAGRMEEAAATYARARAIADSRLPEGPPVRASLKYSDASLH